MNASLSSGNALINFIAPYLGGVSLALPEAVDYGQLFAFAKKHSLESLAAYAVSNAALELSPQVKKLCKEAIFRGIRSDEIQRAETEKICRCLEERNVPYMLLKGSVLKGMYPCSDCRSMSDVDFLIDRSGREAAAEILCSLGYEQDSDDGDNASFRKLPHMNIEMHTVLMNRDIPLYYAYFGEGLCRTHEVGGTRRAYSDEDFFIFMAAHAAKHYFLGGTGIRTVLDFWIYKSKKPQLDFEYINAELQKLHLNELVDAFFSLAEVWFCGKEPTEKDLSVEEYVFDSGVHGSTENVGALAAEVSGGKQKYLLRRIFPSFAYMSENYPAVKKAKILLPLFWLFRLLKIPFVREKSDIGEIKGVVTAKASLRLALSIDGNPKKNNGGQAND